MYVTRRLCVYYEDQAALCIPPPEGPNSGYLVISDAETETRFGLQRDQRIRRLPFPQNRDLTIPTDNNNSDYNLLFVPVLNHPLSANRYYLIWTHGEDTGKAMRSSKEEDRITTCCCGDYIPDASPCPLQPFNLDHQFEIIQKPHDRFQVKSITPDGIPPRFLGEEHWTMNYYTPRQMLSEALGLNSSLRAQLPDLDIPLSSDQSQPVVVGKWYCPLMFVNEYGKKLKKTEKSLFYEMTLEQRWIRVFSKENSNSREKVVAMEVVVQTEAAKIAGIRDAFWDEKDVGSGFLWFTSYDGGKAEKIGLSMTIVERMKWEQERARWAGGGNQRLERVEEFEGSDMWKRFSCYLLVETFVLKRKDKSLVLTYAYKHTHQIRCKWE